jgi:hypothetical protein
MWYKEWFGVRSKLILAAVIMFGLVLLRVTSMPLTMTTSERPNSSYFPTWVGIAVFFIALIGIIGGADLFSAEKDQNTFSFLLAKPVSRAKVFAVKLGLNAASIGVVVVGSSLLLLFFDNMPRTVTYQEVFTFVDANGCTSWTFGPPTNIPAVGTSLGAALPTIAAGVALGWAALCLTAVISLFTSNVLHSCVLSLMALTFLGIGLVTTTTISLGNEATAGIYKPSVASVYLGILATLTFGFVVLGARIFKRKEF